MPVTHHRGPLLGDVRTGPIRNFPVELAQAFPRDGNCVWAFYDFNTTNDFDFTNDWTELDIGAGASTNDRANATISQDFGGIGILIQNNFGLDQGNQLQLVTPFYFPTDAAATGLQGHCAVGFRFYLVDVNNTDIFLGLAEPTALTGILSTAGILTSDNHAGFHKLQAATTLTFSAAGTDDTDPATSALTAPTLVDSTFIDIAVDVRGADPAATPTSGGHARGWINGDLVAEVQIPQAWENTPGTNRMLLSVASVSEAAGDDLYLDYCWIAKTRDITQV